MPSHHSHWVSSRQVTGTVSKTRSTSGLHPYACTNMHRTSVQASKKKEGRRRGREKGRGGEGDEIEGEGGRERES